MFNKENQINNMMASAIEKIKNVISTETVVGIPFETKGGTLIVPLTKVSVGFVVGGGEYADLSSRRVANHFPMSGGSSGGMSVSPVGFLIIQADGAVDFVNVENKTLYQTIVNLVNSVLRKIDDDQTAQKEEKNEN